MKKTFLSLLCFLILVFTYSIKINAQEINCLDCHENLIAKTVHDGKIKCGDCHDDVIKEEHSKATVKKVECKKCHLSLDAQMKNDVHRKLKHLTEDKAPNCKTCHGTHKIISPSSVANKDKTYCGKCHKTSIMKVPYHSVSKTNDNCSKCHTKNDHKLELSKSVHKNLSCANCHSYVVNNIDNHQKAPKDGVLADCYLCHSAIAKEHKESIHGLSLTEGINEAAQCWDCHGSHEIYPVKDKKSSVYPVTQLAAELGIAWHHGDLTPSDVVAADEVLLTSTSPCVLPVVRFNGQDVGSGRPGPIHARLLTAWSQMVGLDIRAQAQRFAAR